MTTLTRTNSRATPAYKDYVNFLGGYKNGKKDDENSDSTISVSSFSLSHSDSSTSSTSVSSDVTDFSRNTCTPYNTYLEKSKTKKFNPVKPNLEEKPVNKKSEIFIEIQPTKSVSEVSKIFEKQQNAKVGQKGNKVNSKISIFEKQISVENKPKIGAKPKNQPPPQIAILTTETNGRTSPPLPPPPPEFLSSQSEDTLPPPPPEFMTTHDVPPPPPPLPTTVSPKLQATLNNGPQTKFSVNNPKGLAPNEIDRNDPMVRKLVYGTLRGLYGAYHDKANDMLSTLPRNMVVRSNGVQDRIEQIASNGDLDKLNGRVNPKLEE